MIVEVECTECGGLGIEPIYDENGHPVFDPARLQEKCRSCWVCGGTGYVERSLRPNSLVAKKVKFADVADAGLGMFFFAGGNVSAPHLDYNNALYEVHSHPDYKRPK